METKERVRSIHVGGNAFEIFDKLDELLEKFRQTVEIYKNLQNSRRHDLINGFSRKKVHEFWKSNDHADEVDFFEENLESNKTLQEIFFMRCVPAEVFESLKLRNVQVGTIYSKKSRWYMRTKVFAEGVRNLKNVRSIRRTVVGRMRSSIIWAILVFIVACIALFVSIQSDNTLANILITLAGVIIPGWILLHGRSKAKKDPRFNLYEKLLGDKIIVAGESYLSGGRDSEFNIDLSHNLPIDLVLRAASLLEKDFIEVYFAGELLSNIQYDSHLWNNQADITLKFLEGGSYLYVISRNDSKFLFMTKFKPLV